MACWFEVVPSRAWDYWKGECPLPALGITERENAHYLESSTSSSDFPYCQILLASLLIWNCWKITCLWISIPFHCSTGPRTLGVSQKLFWALLVSTHSFEGSRKGPWFRETPHWTSILGYFLMLSLWSPLIASCLNLGSQDICHHCYFKPELA